MLNIEISFYYIYNKRNRTKGATMKKNICVMACVFSLFLPIKPSSSNSNQYSCHKLEDSIEENEFQKSGRPSESILTYNDIFREYYDLVTYKLKKRNIDFNLPFSSFCENYYSSNLKLNEYVEFYSGSSSEFENEKSFSRTRSPLRSSGSKDEKYILKDSISFPKDSNGKPNKKFDPDKTPVEAILREIRYASASAYDKIADGDIIIETHTSQFNMGHAAYIYDINKSAEGKLTGRSTYIQTIEAVGGGVQFGFLDDQRMVEFGVIIVRPSYTNSIAVSDSKDFIYKQLGKPYYLPITEGSCQTSINSEHWYCSELIYAAYYHANTIIARADTYGWIWPFYILWSNTIVFVPYNNTLEIRYLGKINNQFRVRIYNRTGKTRKVYYNSKKCFIGDAKNWSNLNDWQNNQITVYDKSYGDVHIASNWFADTFAVSYVDENKRYITYANEINDDTLRMAVYKNVINV